MPTEGDSGRSSLPPCAPRRRAVDTQQKTDENFHRLMHDFDALLLDASRGKLKTLPVPEDEYVPILTHQAAAATSLTHDFFHHGTFTQIAGHPSSVSRVSSSSSIDTQRLPVRLAPLQRSGATTSVTGEDFEEPFVGSSHIHQARLKPVSHAKGLGESPRPHSVPAAHSDCLVISEPRPATTGIHEPALASSVSAIDAELIEIARLRKARDDEVVRRTQERERRRQLRSRADNADCARDEPPIATEAANDTVNSQSGPSEPSYDRPQRQQIQAEIWELARIAEEAAAVNFELERIGRESKEAQQQHDFHILTSKAAYELEKLQVIEEAHHKLRLKRIHERGTAFDSERVARDKQRCWELVRDTSCDEELRRKQLVAAETRSWDALVSNFFNQLDDGCMAVKVEERLLRTEHWYAAESELFVMLQCREIYDRETILRRRIERCWDAMTSRDLWPLIERFTISTRIHQNEVAQRRHIVIAQEIAKNVLWQLFCEEVQPVVARELWKVTVQEANERILLEHTEAESAETAFHGCVHSWELVSRYAAIVRETSRRAAEQRETLLRDLFDDELAGRLLMQRDQRSEFILLEETCRRGLNDIKSQSRKLAMEEAILAAEQFRMAELTRRELESAVKRHQGKSERSTVAGTKKPSPLPKRVVQRPEKK